MVMALFCKENHISHNYNIGTSTLERVKLFKYLVDLQEKTIENIQFDVNIT